MQKKSGGESARKKLKLSERATQGLLPPPKVACGPLTALGRAARCRGLRSRAKSASAFAGWFGAQFGLNRAVQAKLITYNPAADFFYRTWLKRSELEWSV